MGRWYVSWKTWKVPMPTSFDLFWLYLSFIGWGILCLFTAGIGFLWLGPYIETSVAAFYEDVKADYELNGGLI